MRVRNMACFCVCIIFVLGTGCSGESVDGFSFGDLFSDVPSSPVKIVNGTDIDLLLFKGDLKPENALGGVPVGKTFGIKKVEGFYLMKAISKQQAEALYPDFSGAKVLYATLVYVADDWTTNVIQLPSSANASILVKNQSTEYVDLAQDSWYGATVTVIGPGETRRHFLPEGDYRFFPSRVTTIMSSSSIVGFKRTWLLTSADLYSLKDGDLSQEIIIPASVSVEDKTAYLYIKNKYGQGLNFLSGNVVQKSTLNREIINRDGGVQVFEYKPNPSVSFGVGVMRFANVQGLSVATNNVAISLGSGQKRYLEISTTGQLLVDVTPF